MALVKTGDRSDLIYSRGAQSDPGSKNKEIVSFSMKIFSQDDVTTSFPCLKTCQVQQILNWSTDILMTQTS